MPSVPDRGLVAAACATGHGPQTLLRDAAMLDGFEDAAEALVAAGAMEDAVALVRLAANIANLRHPGAHASPRLERVLAAVAAARLTPLPPRERPTEAARVLHVVTETYEVGGHTRVVWRWIDRDGGRRHTVATTSQRAPMPEGLAAAARRSGGGVVALPPAAPVLERAQAVRDLAADADVVVVHAHPHDPVPTLALAGAEHRPPVIVFNHGDHLFWLGAAIADVLHCLRPGGVDLATSRRGIAPERCALAPFPLVGDDAQARGADNAVSAEQRAVARRLLFEQLGWPANTVLLMTVGTPFKYQGPGGTTLLDAVLPVLEEDARVRLLAAGVDDTGDWAAARARTGGRVLAIGRRPRVSALLTAADVYVESKPFPGTSASSEAAAHGLPVLTTAESAEEAAVFCAEPGFGATVLLGVDAYRDELRALTADPRRRREAGRAARVSALASDRRWAPALRGLYAQALASDPIDPAALGQRPAGLHPLDPAIHLVNVEHMGGADDAALERLRVSLDLVVRSPAIRALFPSLEALAAPPRRPYEAAFATPGAAPEALAAVVEEFRLLAAAQAAERFVLALSPADVDAAVPVLEAALGDDDGLTVDLVIDHDPARVRPPWSVALAAPGAPAPAWPAHVWRSTAGAAAPMEVL